MAAFVHALTEGRRWADLFRSSRHEVRAERIGFVQLPKPAGPPTPGRSGGDGRPVSRTPSRPTPQPQAPSTVPDRIEPASPAPATPAPAGGSGPVVGSGGAATGIQPSYTDPRLWARPGQVSTAPRNAKERIDSVIAETFTGVRDSMIAEQEALAGQRKPGDWTMKGPGGKWGMDQSAIHLGKVAIPNALLALLSESFQQNLRGNPIQMQEDRRLAAVRADLLQHAQTEMNEDAFRSAVKQIRARKDRERAARASGQGTTADGSSSGQPDRR
ncbi:MAG: hypothetical protein JO180_00965 [Gemmatirosa sp.]|nr:hypothetical protein [Gemmatirosa sp.]